MGVVYLAEHTVLGRRVAIKTGNANHGRFLREARAASALSHPHIATIHDYGETENGEPYIVMEYVQGKTLADLIREGGLNIPQSLRIVRRVAEALNEAHRHNIIHRDIKPSNIMVDDRGIVKVLDFGLAKQIGLQPIEEGTDPNSRDTKTREGLLVGTPMYFSPEQALGVALDPRSDLFSLGMVLYECLTGKPAFTGETPMEICAKVIRDNPVPPSQINPAVSDDLERVTLRALEKSADKRYQSASELASDLQILEASLSSSEIGRLSIDQTQPVVNRETVIIDRGRNGKRLALLVFGVLLVSVIAAWLIFRKQPQAQPSAHAVQQRVGIVGNAIEAAISPDGKYIAYVNDEAGRQSIRLRQITPETDIQIVSPGNTKYKGLSFFPDGDSLSYLKTEGDSADLYQVATIGGNSRKLAGTVDTPVSFSPDGKQFTFVRYSRDANETALIIADADGNNERAVKTVKAPQLFSRGGFYSSGPAWSPDGMLIAVPAYSVAEKTYREIILVNVADETMNTINPGRWNSIEKLVWLADGSGFLMNAAEANSDLLQIWLVNRQGHVAQRVTEDPRHYAGLSATRDSRLVLTIKTEKITSVFIHGDSLPLPSSRYHGTQGIAWTTDSRFMLASNIHGNYEIWTMHGDGSNQKQLTFTTLTNVEPALSPDGRYIVYVSYDGRHPHIYRRNADGTNLKQLTSGGDEDLPRFTPDGKWVVYHSINDKNFYSIRKVSLDGGEPITLVSDWSTQPDVSPDGKKVACFAKQEGATVWEIFVVPIEGGSPIATFALPNTVEPEWPGLRWTPDGKHLTYVSTVQGVSNIWSQALKGGKPKQLTDFKENQIFFFDWSLTNQKLVLVRGSENRDLILVSEFLSANNDTFELFDLF
jgi:serine/threonine protein kinase/Tol biopolymer transport system component